MTRIGIALVVAVLTAASVRAEGLPSILSAEGQAFLVGLRAVEGDANPEPMPHPETRKGKSSKRAFLLSALVPGLGEWYAGSKKRGLAFLGAEAALVGLMGGLEGQGQRPRARVPGRGRRALGSGRIHRLAHIVDLELVKYASRAAL